MFACQHGISIRRQPSKPPSFSMCLSSTTTCSAKCPAIARSNSLLTGDRFRVTQDCRSLPPRLRPPTLTPKSRHRARRQIRSPEEPIIPSLLGFWPLKRTISQRSPSGRWRLKKLLNFSSLMVALVIITFKCGWRGTGARAVRE